MSYKYSIFHRIITNQINALIKQHNNIWTFFRQAHKNFPLQKLEIRKKLKTVKKTKKETNIKANKVTFIYKSSQRSSLIYLLFNISNLIVMNPHNAIGTWNRAPCSFYTQQS